jgi:hypothetical protein
MKCLQDTKQNLDYQLTMSLHPPPKSIERQERQNALYETL